MSRTYRNNRSDLRDNIVYYVGDERCHFWLSKGGWKEAKKILPKKNYAEARRNLGDSYARRSCNGGVTWWFRNELEKQHRWQNRRELHRYTRNADYEPMVCESPSGDEWYYW